MMRVSLVLYATTILFFVRGVAACGASGAPSATTINAVSGNSSQAAVAFAECMRKHGAPNYPDPTFPAGGGIAQGLGIDRSAPAVQAGAAVCGKAAS